MAMKLQRKKNIILNKQFNNITNFWFSEFFFKKHDGF